MTIPYSLDPFRRYPISNVHKPNLKLKASDLKNVHKPFSFMLSLVVIFDLFWLIYAFILFFIKLNPKKKAKNKSNPFWTRIWYWIHSIHGSGYGYCKTRPADPGLGLDLGLALENGSGFRSTWTRSRSDPLPFLWSSNLQKSIAQLLISSAGIGLLELPWLEPVW